MEKGRISGRQLMYLTIILVFSTGVMILPAIVGESAKQDTWIAGLLVTGFGVLFSWPLGALARRFPHQSPSEYSVLLLGTFVGRLVMLILFVFCLHSGAIVAREFGELMVLVLMPETPLSVFILIQVWLACLAVRNGIEVIARVNELWMPILLVVTLIVLALVFKDGNFRMLQPVLERGWGPVMSGMYAPAAWMGETVILLFALGALNQPAEGTVSLMKGQVATGLIMTMVAVVTVVVFGPERVSEFVFPTLRLARMIDVARFVTRIESLIIILWLVGTMIKMALFLHAAAVGLAQALGLAEYVPLVLPLGALTVTLAIGMFPDVPSLQAFLAGPWPGWALTVELGIPFLLLGAAWLKRPMQKAPCKAGEP